MRLRRWRKRAQDHVDAWRFIRKLDAEQLTRLHPSTLTALLEPEDETTAEAAKTDSKPAGVDFSTLAYLP